ncbi:MAG TPA: alpha-amylase family glycosyl hydrolase, partial [Candidatus Eisenbacteria bacterium]|nr:alpha-amylase family glycosyl hydrolase [Candidatus Eisenbacteria bacterium]
MNPPPRPRRGWPEPLGASLAEGGVNFAVWSRHATAMTLALFQPGGGPWAELPLPPATHRSGDVWHAFVPGAGPGIEYGWRAASTHRGPQHAFDPARLLLDPWGRAVAGAEAWGRREPEGRRLRSVVVDDAFAWGGDQPLRRPAADTVIYELHVRAFTRHPSAGVAHPGTYAGLVEKLPHLAALGVTAVQLMPVAEFDETDNPRTHPRTGAPLLNVWGYAPLAFGAPKLAYAADATPAGAVREFKRLVRAAHAAGLEVFLDVVFNHTGEGGPGVPARSWKGLDRAAYFLLDRHGHDLDVTGCGHTFACASPPAADLIVGMLRRWAVEYHVDGFRFDLASVLARGPDGAPLAEAPLTARIAADPALAHVKLIAEPWDAGGLYQVGSFPHHGRWAELNGRFRDDARRFVTGAPVAP